MGSPSCTFEPPSDLRAWLGPKPSGQGAGSGEDEFTFTVELGQTSGLVWGLGGRWPSTFSEGSVAEGHVCWAAC